MTPQTLRLTERYLTAKELVVASGFGSEIDWQDDLNFSEQSESDFLREYAWVVLSSGMRESVIRAKFDAVSAAFLNWGCSISVARHADRCRRRALRIFNHPGKIGAIVATAKIIAQRGYGDISSQIRTRNIDAIREFPYMGPATAYHLAKNMGLDVVKPDRHLLRISRSMGFPDPLSLCSDISRGVGDPVAVVDVVLWRYATLRRDYLNLFSTGSRPS